MTMVDYNTALIFTKKVNERLGGERFSNFILAFDYFREGTIDLTCLHSIVKKLFLGNEHLLHELNSFLPNEYAINFEDHKASPKKKRDADINSALKEAIDFVNKVKKRFKNDDHVYKSFLDCMGKFQSGHKMVNLNQLCNEVSRLFKSDPDLDIEFTRLIADCFETETEENPWGFMARGRKEGYVTNIRRNTYEKIMFDCEDDMYETDMLLHLLESTGMRVKVLCESPFDVNIKEQLTDTHLRCIERLYDEYGLDVVELLIKKPDVALPIILARLVQKFIELVKYRSEAEKVCARIFKKCHREALNHLPKQDSNSLSPKLSATGTIDQ